MNFPAMKNLFACLCACEMQWLTTDEGLKVLGR